MLQDEVKKLLTTVIIDPDKIHNLEIKDDPLVSVTFDNIAAYAEVIVNLDIEFDVEIPFEDLTSTDPGSNIRYGIVSRKFTFNRSVVSRKIVNSSITFVITNHRYTNLIKPATADRAYGSGLYNAGAYGRGSSTARAYGSDVYGSGKYGTGDIIPPSPTDAYGSGVYGAGSYGTGVASGGAAYGSGLYGEGNYNEGVVAPPIDALDYGATAYGSGGYSHN